MSPPVCPTCQGAIGAVDRYCGRCGAPLAVLCWVTGEREEARDAQVVLRQEVDRVGARLVNRGVVPLGVALLPPSAGSAAWLGLPPGPPVLAVLAPGEARELGFPVSRAALGKVLAGGVRAGGQTAARVPVRTSGWVVEEEGLRPDDGVLLVQVARDPWVAPAVVQLPFVPLERLAEGPLPLRLELRNETAEPLRITGVVVAADEQVPVSGELLPVADHVAVRLPADPVARPGGAAPIEVELRWPRTRPPPEGLVSVAAELRFTVRLESTGAIAEVVGRVAANLGRAPTLLVDGKRSSSHDVDARAGEARLVLPLRNPGHLPVRVLEVELRGDGEPGAGPWLRVEGIGPGDVVDPGRELRIELTARPGTRGPDELSQRRVSRELRVRHDGGAKGDEGLLSLRVTGTFEPALLSGELFIGVDFGTTNSTVCVLRNDRWAGLVVEPQGPGDPRTMASVLFFDCGTPGAAGRDPLRVGKDAVAAAGQQPANVVRSMKRLVARGETEVFLFHCRSPEGRFHTHEYSAQALLNHFIRSLRDRAQANLHLLPADAREDILDGHRAAVLRKAVFTHPVEVGPELTRLLRGAAAAAGLDDGVQDDDHFLEDRTVDEATAAVLAYVFWRAGGRLDPGLPWLPEERVVCFDVGGGTTDVAAATVTGLPGPDGDPEEPWEVMLEFAQGDSGFGGDNLDELVARRILRELARWAEREGAPIATEDVADALRGSPFDTFRAAYLGRRGVGPGHPDEARVADEARSRYEIAQRLREYAEQAKRLLGEGRAAPLTVEVPSALRRQATAPGRAEAATCSMELDAIWFRDELVNLVRPRLALLDTVVQRAGWRWDDVTTLLFTGQTCRMPLLRDLVLGHVRARRGDREDPPVVVAPGSVAGVEDGFDPKLCVALGAAVWGASAEAGIGRVRQRAAEQLGFDVQLRMPMGVRAIPGLQAGAPLPARGSLLLTRPRDSFTLCRDGKDFMRFQLPTPVDVLDVEVHGPGDVRVAVAGRSVPGQRVER